MKLGQENLVSENHFIGDRLLQKCLAFLLQVCEWLIHGAWLIDSVTQPIPLCGPMCEQLAGNLFNNTLIMFPHAPCRLDGECV